MTPSVLQHMAARSTISLWYRRVLFCHSRCCASMLANGLSDEPWIVLRLCCWALLMENTKRTYRQGQRAKIVSGAFTNAKPPVPDDSPIHLIGNVENV